MRQRLIETKFWTDEKIQRAPWLEKVVMFHLLTRVEMLTLGAITTSISSMEHLLNGVGRNWQTPELPRIQEKHIARSLASLKRRKIIEIQNTGDTTVFFRNFLVYQNWSSSVVKSWPRMIEEQIPQGFIQAVIKETCVEWCQEKRIELPDEWSG